MGTRESSIKEKDKSVKNQAQKTKKALRISKTNRLFLSEEFL